MNLDITLIAIVIFGIITSYTDIKKGKIKNVHIILLLVVGLLVNIFFSKTLVRTEDPDFVQTITNFLIAFGFGFSLWLAGLWSTGDAKLFLGYSFLLPVFAYNNGYIQYFPSLVIVINTFIPAAFFYILNSLSHINIKSLKKYMKEMFTLSSLLNTVLFLFGFSFLIQLVVDPLNLKLDLFSQTFVLFILMELLSKIKFISLNKLNILFSILRIIFSFNSIFELSYIQNFLTSILLFYFLRILLVQIIEFSFTEDVKIKNLKPGMMLAEKLVRQKGTCVKQQTQIFTPFDLIRGAKEGLLSDVVSTNLTENDIKDLERLHATKKLKFESVKIAKTVPFAPFMFLGVLITYLLQGSIFYYISLIKLVLF